MTRRQLWERIAIPQVLAFGLCMVYIGWLIGSAGQNTFQYTRDARPAYSRNVGVAITTRSNGSYVVRCHNYRLLVPNGNSTGTRGTFLFGGCLKPEKV